ncbi:hypothetical protein Bhyg_01855 [Pseudolycoriella hygida]|uniref:Uncharacterized protein n=1 Tax=Pseudolycoriella hygida TaxID=35572 RepID=A0A9Q0S5Z5_9DIPT|nr:hypothetical protein Bhyg_01855 [Pseudolycoriella hygida]
MWHTLTLSPCSVYIPFIKLPTTEPILAAANASCSGSNGRMPNASSNGLNEIHDDDIARAMKMKNMSQKKKMKGFACCSNQQSNGVDRNVNNGNQILPAKQQMGYTAHIGAMHRSRAVNFSGRDS